MGPLDGMRILELAGMGPVPFCGMLLADFGAEVIRVDRPESVGRDQPWELRGRNKRSIALDLKSGPGRRALFDLIAGADALIEGYRPGGVERLGVGPADAWARNPRLVYGRATGWGQSGPMADRAGHDINYIALTGALDMIGPPGGAPVPPLNLVGDYGGGAMFLAAGVLAALLEAGRTGKGQVVDAAMVDGVNLLLSVFYGFLAQGALQAGRGQNLLDGGAPWYATYLTADGKYMAVGALEDRFFAELLEGLELSPHDVPDRNRRENWPAIRALMARRFLERTRDDWSAVFAARDACVSPVLSLAEAMREPHNMARGSTMEVAGIDHPCPAPRFPAHPRLRTSPPAAAGADTRAVLRDLGWAEGEIADAFAAGAVAEVPRTAVEHE